MRKVKNFRTGSWVHAIAPTEEDITWLVDNLGLEEGHVRDALDQFEVPRFEVKESIKYIFTRLPKQTSGEIATQPLLIALGENFVVTVSQEELPFMEKFIKKHKSSPSFSTTQKSKLVILLLTQVSRGYNTYLTKIRRQIRTAQVGLQNITNKNIMQLVTFESTLNDFVNSLQPTHTILGSLKSGRILPLFDDDQDMLEDLYLSTGQLIELSRAQLKAIIHIREAYSTILTNNLNRTIRVLTILTVLLTVPTVVTSFYGMNVPLPFMGSEYAFLGLLGIIAFVSLSIYLTLRKKNVI